MVKAQAKLPSARFNKTNPHFKNKYTDLAGLWDVARPVLAEFGLCVVQSPMTPPDGKQGVVIKTTILHESGESMSSDFFMPSERPNAQGIGSAITYGRRYGLATMLGLVSDEDDDGNDAATPPSPAKAATKPSGASAAMKALGGPETRKVANTPPTPLAEPANRDNIVPDKEEITRLMKQRSIPVTTIRAWMDGKAENFEQLSDDYRLELLADIHAGRLDPKGTN